MNMLLANMLLGVVAFSGAHATTEHPIGKVISLLEDLQAQAKIEGEHDASTYQKFTYWCSNAQKDISASMNSHEESIEATKDSAKAAKSDIMALEFAVKKLTKEISRRMSSAERAKKNREEQAAEYDEDQADYTATIEAFTTAIKAMELTQLVQEKSSSASKQKHLLAKRAVKKVIMLAESRVDEEKLQVLKSFVQTGAAPHSQGVDHHGSIVIDLLKSLKADFEKQLVENTKEETERKNNYNLAKFAQEYAISEAESNKGDKNGDLGVRKGDLATNMGTLDDEESSLAADTVQLKNVRSDCTTKASEWDVRSSTRTNELKAMEMAVTILAKVTGVRNPDEHEVPKRVYLAQVSLLQINDPKAKAVNLLKEAATRTHSKALQKLAASIATFDGPFDKINAMIQKMIFRLIAEQKDEDEHKQWCDLELEKTTESKDSKTDRMELLNAKIATANADVADLTRGIAEDEEASADLTKYMEEEKALRGENHEENLATVADAQKAQQAVAGATAVLKSFYKESGMIAKEPYEFLQSEPEVTLPEKPENWDASYTGTADPEAEGSGVLAILGECGANFASMEADAASQEETDQKAFDDDMTSSSMDKAEKQNLVQKKTAKKTALAEKLDSMTNNKAHLTKELEAAEQYLNDLEPACVSGDSSYAERKAARGDEITALRKAQTILDEAFKPSSFLQVRK